jgi:hypothetical protein
MEIPKETPEEKEWLDQIYRDNQEKKSIRVV